MSKLTDLAGHKFGEWTVIDYAGDSKWNCVCSCGTERTVYGGSLKGGGTKSCGCKSCEFISKAKTKSMLGKRYGNLTVTEEIGKDKCRVICDCGKEKIISRQPLRSGHIKSCGCGKVRNFVGERYGRLTVLEVAFIKNGRQYLKCKCDCGNETIINSGNWGRETKSCGCLLREKNRTHGLRFTRLHSVWNSMKNRCYNPNEMSYKYYGGRGITVCDEWKEDYKAFYDWAYANGYDENAPYGECTIDRIDVNGNYEPSNCRWVDMKKQRYNTRQNVFYDYNGERLALTELSEKYNINISTLWCRLHRGMSIAEAIETPVKS